MAPVKWSYKSDSKAFKSWFDDIYKIYKDCFAKIPLDYFVTDVGKIKFSFLYENGEKDSNDFPFTGDFDDLLRHLLKMVPEAEETPVMLSNPKYYNAIKAYVDTLGDFERDSALDLTFESIDNMMKYNMGGGLPIQGFYEMKQEVYETAAKDAKIRKW